MSLQTSTTKPKLLVRTQRTTGNLKLQPFDRRVLLLTSRPGVRVLSSDHIYALVGEALDMTYCLHRLQTLFRYGYLDRPRQQDRALKSGRGSPRMIYALG